MRKGRGWYVDFPFRHADGAEERVRRRSPVQTRRGAEDYERQLRQQMLNPVVKRCEVVLAEFAREFMEIYGKAELKYAAQVTYQASIDRYLVPELGKRRLDKIDEAAIDRLAAKLSVGRSPKTVRNHLGVLSKMLRTAKRWGHIQRVPEFRMPRAPRPSFRFLGQEESDALLGHAGAYWAPAIDFALMTGVRQGELLAMEREQIDFDRRIVTIDRAVWRGVVGLPKHDKVRRIELSPGLVARMKEHLRIRPLRSMVVFPQEGGSMRQERKADQGLRRACRRAGIEPCGWHVLRHTFASRLAMAGVPIPVIQELLGHSDIRMTMRYAHLEPASRRSAVEKLDALRHLNGTGESAVQQVGGL
ncbi:MAG: site-specific integrase [Deltaproteobacteria bacterium]|nr:site-specific integrase [Deltaproteobacteria bacterium]